MRKPVLIAVLALIPVSFAHAQIPTAERDALIALYNATNGPGWRNGSGWLGAVDTECTWHGVSCALGHVSRLVLPSNQLTGALPAAVGDLMSLQWLHLYTNQLSGSIPPEIENLTSLQSLRMGANQLTGSLPPEIGYLTALRGIELFNNQLSGNLPPELGNLPFLSMLSLYNNQLTGSLPPELGDISSLRTVILSGNQLSGSIPPELGNITGMTGLDLGYNDLTGSIPTELGNLTDLYVLDLASNQLSGSIPPAFGTFSNLIYLELNNNQLSGAIPTELSNLTNLQKLYLRTNRLSGNIPPELGDLAALKELTLSHNRLTGSIPPELGDLSILERLYLYSNQLSGDIPTELESLTSLLTTNGLRIRWNALHTDDASLISFLDDKQWHDDWDSTQTIAPENVIVTSQGNHTVWLSWDAVSYQDGSGGYEVLSSPAGSGVWTSCGWTGSKATITFPATGLDPGTSYDFAAATRTDPHTDNLNLVKSDLSAPVMTTTASTGCAQPVIEITGTGDGPFTLSLTESYDAYAWSTAETTSTVVASPPYGQWYWVTVTSTGPCTETAAVLVDPDVFGEDFEFGDTAEWSNAVP